MVVCELAPAIKSAAMGIVLVDRFILEGVIATSVVADTLVSRSRRVT